MLTSSELRDEHNLNYAQTASKIEQDERHEHLSPQLSPGVINALERRGPDAVNARVICAGHLTMAGAVLHLRGDRVLPQPVRDDQHNWLLWNGEAYECGPMSDTDYVSNQLSRIAKSWKAGHQDDFSTQMIETMQRILGPWAFIWWHASTSTLWYGRDPLGRRSLLVRRSRDERGAEVVELASAVGRDSGAGWAPVEASGLHSVVMNTEKVGPFNELLSLKSYEWNASRHPRFGMKAQTTNIAEVLSNATELSGDTADNPQDLAEIDPGTQVPAQRLLHSALDASVRRRVQNISRHGVSRKYVIDGKSALTSHIGILFSGGLDCTVLAAIAHRHILPCKEPIDLINVCFDAKNHASPDRQTAILSYVELCSKFPDRQWRFVAVDATVSDVHQVSEYVASLVYPSSAASSGTSEMDINIGTALWFAARGSGTLISLAEAKILAVGFESRVAEAIQHMNQNHKSDDKSVIKKKRKKQKKHPTLQEDVPKCDSVEAKAIASNSVRTFKTDPADSVSGFTRVSYSSSCRVLLSGLGADEYLAGYGRHRTAFRRGGCMELRRELLLDAERLPERNHGRDDRCISDHGREVRYPFLDEEVIRVIGSLKMHDIADMSLPRGQGEKRILRLIAQDILGLDVCSGLPKRALQFGSRMVQSIEKERKRMNKKEAVNKDKKKI